LTCRSSWYFVWSILTPTFLAQIKATTSFDSVRLACTKYYSIDSHESWAVWFVKKIKDLPEFALSSDVHFHILNLLIITEPKPTTIR
jgi:hypothetical protein